VLQVIREGLKEEWAIARVDNREELKKTLYYFKRVV